MQSVCREEGSLDGPHGVMEQKSGAEAPHLLSSNQDIVALSQEEKCGLKYVIHTPGGSVWISVERTYIEHWNYADMISICRVSLNIKN